MSHHASLRKVWTWPIVIAALSTLGLGAGLVSDGWGDVLAWLGLAVPAVISLWALLRRV